MLQKRIHSTPNSNGENRYEYYPFLARKLSDCREIDDDDLHQGVCVCVYYTHT